MVGVIVEHLSGARHHHDADRLVRYANQRPERLPVSERRAHVDRDDDLGAHLTRYVGWHVVQQPAVRQQALADLDRFKDGWNRHGGA